MLPCAKTVLCRQSVFLERPVPVIQDWCWGQVRWAGIEPGVQPRTHFRWAVVNRR